MAVYSNVTITDAGTQLLRDIVLDANKNLTAFKVKTSADVMANPQTATTVTNPVQIEDYSIYSQAEHQFILEAQLTNSTVESAYPLNTIGFFATDGAGGPQTLLAVINAQTPDTVPAGTQYPIMLGFKAIISIDNDGNVSINVSFVGFATLGDVQDSLETAKAYTDQQLANAALEAFPQVPTYKEVTFDDYVKVGGTIPTTGTIAVLTENPDTATNATYPYLLNKFVDNVSDGANVLVKNRDGVIISKNGQIQEYYILNGDWEPLGVDLTEYFRKSEVLNIVAFSKNTTLTPENWTEVEGEEETYFEYDVSDTDITDVSHIIIDGLTQDDIDTLKMSVEGIGSVSNGKFTLKSEMPPESSINIFYIVTRDRTGSVALPHIVKVLSNKSQGDTEQAIVSLQGDLVGKAPTKHIAQDTTYGAGDEQNYGHLKPEMDGATSLSMQRKQLGATTLNLSNFTNNSSKSGLTDFSGVTSITNGPEDTNFPNPASGYVTVFKNAEKQTTGVELHLHGYATVWTWNKEGWVKIEGGGGGMNPTLIVNAPTGSTITVVKGSRTLTGTSAGAPISFNMPEFGEWVVTATLTGQTATQTINITTIQEYTCTLSYFSANLTVTSSVGAEVTATDGTHTYTGTVGSGGTVVLVINYPNTYTISATLNGETSIPVDVNITTTGQEYTASALFIDPVFSNNSPAQIAKGADQIVANNWTPAQVTSNLGWSVGDEITVTFKTAVLGSSSAILRIIDFNKDNRTGGGKNGITFDFKNSLVTTAPMNSSNTNTGSWEASKARTETMALILAALPDEWQEIIKFTDKITGVYNGETAGGTNITTSDKLFLLAEQEIFGTRTYSTSNESSALSQYKLYADNNTATFRIKNLGDTGSATSWWERSPRYTSSSSFCRVDSNGSADYSASSSFGISPSFCV